MTRTVVLRAPCGCIRVLAPAASWARQGAYRREAAQRGYTYEAHRGPVTARLRATWTCGDADCPFQAEVRAEEGR